jgi:hypothetical protein
MALSSVPPNYVAEYAAGQMSFDSRRMVRPRTTPVEIEYSLVWSEDLLLKATRLICQRHNLSLVNLTSIQKKFLTHYRCSNCGLLPLYYVNVSHAKRVRCNRCHDLVPFKARGKYGKIRKAIAFELAKDAKGDGVPGAG